MRKRDTGHERLNALAEAALVKLQREREAAAPRLDPPICWVCDRKLYARRGRIIVAEDGHAHPAHAGCAARYTPPLTAQPTGGDEQESRP